jgi:insulysin
MQDVTLEKFTEFVKEFVKKVKFEWLIYGNITSAEATELVSNCEKHFEKKESTALLPSQTSRLREINLPEGSNHIYQSEHKSHLSSCAAILFQTGMQSTRDNVLVELLEHIANEPCFNQLRTKEQLGYIVFTGVRRAHGTQGIQFLVQSDRHPVFVESRIDSFLTALEDILSKMTEEEFVQHRTAVFVRKSEKPKKMVDRANLLWTEIVLQQFNFERQAVELAELDTVSLKEIRDFYTVTMGPSSNRKKRLSIHVVSMAEGGAGRKEEEKFTPSSEQVPIENVVSWKRRQGLYPASAPYTSTPGSGNSKSKL